MSEIEIGKKYPFYKIPIGTVIDYGFFKIDEYEKISKDTIKKGNNVIKIHCTHEGYEIRSLPRKCAFT
jgi:Ser-tRNA(Ala) deacylase AlaX